MEFPQAKAFLVPIGGSDDHEDDDPDELEAVDHVPMLPPFFTRRAVSGERERCHVSPASALSVWTRGRPCCLALL